MICGKDRHRASLRGLISTLRSKFSHTLHYLARQIPLPLAHTPIVLARAQPAATFLTGLKAANLRQGATAAASGKPTSGGFWIQLGTPAHLLPRVDGNHNDHSDDNGDNQQEDEREAHASARALEVALGHHQLCGALLHRLPRYIHLRACASQSYTAGTLEIGRWPSYLGVSLTQEAKRDIRVHLKYTMKWRLKTSYLNWERPRLGK
jgi:hypothetical protein